MLADLGDFDVQISQIISAVSTGIPYAQPPVDDLRFRPPQPVKNWNTERDGTELGKACIQTTADYAKVFKDPKFSIVADPSRLSEDCLTVNVHAPYPTHETSSLPVLVWIHGGGFQWGSNNVAMYNGSIVASEINAVVVIINYRLGPFGFFTLKGVDGVTGNQGLPDQTLAIKWVRDNAKHFGGNAEQITLFGESSGGASVHLQIISPVSRDLFARGIMQSGSARSFWAYRTPEQARQASRAFAAVAGCAEVDDKDLFQCYTSKTTEELAVADAEVKKTNKMNLVPTIDGVFLQKSPAEMMKAGDFKLAPAMTGTTANESMSLIGVFDPDFSLQSTRLSCHDSSISQKDFDDLLLKMTSFVGKATRDAIKFLYRDWNARDERALARERWRMLIAVLDDIFMNNGMVETLDAYVAADVLIYRYRFNRVPKVNIWSYNYNAPVHVDDIPFFFGLPLNPEFPYPKEDVELSRQILQAISNFARTGNPNSAGAQTKQADTDKWKPYADNMDYFTFDTNDYGKVQTAPDRWRVEFWHRAVPYLSKLEAQAGMNAARTDAAESDKATTGKKHPLTEKGTTATQPETEP